MAPDILARFFNKKGIKDINELSPEEKQTFENYERILSKKELNVADIREFLKAQIGLIEGKWKELGLASASKAELLPLHVAYTTLLSALDAPQMEREQLENYLMGLI